MLFADRGCRVVVADISTPAGRAVVARIRAAGGEAEFVRTDVRSSASVRALANRTVRRFGVVDILFHTSVNARLVNTRDNSALDLKEKVFDEIHRVVLRGVFLCVKYLGRKMRQRGGGAIVLTASVDGQIGVPRLDAYSAAKGGVLSLTKSLAASLAPHGIRVNTIAPGFVATEPQMDFLRHPARRADLRSLHLFDIPGPEHIAPLVVFLASDQARYLTGGVHQADSGYAAFKCRHIDVMDTMNTTKPRRKK